MNLNSCIFKNDIFCLSGKYEVILTDYEISHVARREVKCATHARRHFTMRSIASRTKGALMKTKSSYRTLPLIPQVEEVLLAEKQKQDEMMRVMRRGYCKKYTDYICVDAIGELIKPNYVTDHFKVVLKEKGVKPVRFHDLRHSCASLLLANGVPMKMIQDWLGHSDMGTTANIYSHIDSESKKASAMAIGSALG